MAIIEYKLTENGEGFIITRQPQTVSDEQKFSFIGAPPNSTAVFNTAEASYYRNLSGNECTVPAKKMNGEVNVTLAVLGGTLGTKKWRCEGLLIERCKSGEVIIFPNDMNIPEKIVDMKIELDALRRNVLELNKKIQVQEKKLEEISTIKEATKELYELVKNNKYI